MKCQSTIKSQISLIRQAKLPTVSRNPFIGTCAISRCFQRRLEGLATSTNNTFRGGWALRHFQFQSPLKIIGTTSVFVYLPPNFYYNNFDHTFFSAKDFQIHQVFTYMILYGTYFINVIYIEVSKIFQKKKTDGQICYSKKLVTSK